HYEGSATGETFNAAGKTDILVREGNRNLFIGECKIWHGSNKFAEAIDQLLGYLTWRDTKSALIVFSRNKHFTSVIESINTEIERHPHKKRGPDPQAPSDPQGYCVNRSADFYPYTGEPCKSGYQLGSGNCRKTDGRMVAVPREQCVAMAGTVELP